MVKDITQIGQPKLPNQMEQKQEKEQNKTPKKSKEQESEKTTEAAMPLQELDEISQNPKSPRVEPAPVATTEQRLNQLEAVVMKLAEQTSQTNLLLNKIVAEAQSQLAGTASAIPQDGNIPIAPKANPTANPMDNPIVQMILNNVLKGKETPSAESEFFTNLGRKMAENAIAQSNESTELMKAIKQAVVDNLLKGAIIPRS